jgi:hypothetical protein
MPAELMPMAPASVVSRQAALGACFDDRITWTAGITDDRCEQLGWRGRVDPGFSAG